MFFLDPESRLYRSMTSRLLPDTLYAKESGGDPDAIPDLTYAQLKEFHETYYHPSNGYFFLYGDIPTSDYLAFLADKLDKISKNETVASRQPLNPGSYAPTEVEITADRIRYLSRCTRGITY